MIQSDKEMKDSKNKDFIEDLKELSTQEEGCFIVFDKKDITLRNGIYEVEMKMPEEEFYSKVDEEIGSNIESEDIIEMLKHMPSHLELRLESDNTEHIIKLMKSKALIQKLKGKGINFLHNSIEIKPRIIESKQDEDDFINEVKEIEAKKDRLNMDCDK